MTDNWMDEIKPESSKATLTELSTYCKELRDTKAKLETALAEADTLKKKADKLSKEIIPDFMSALGFSSIKLETGETVEVIEDIAVSLPKEDLYKRLEALRYISSLNGGASIIKDEVVISEASQGVKDWLKTIECSFVENRTIHPATLKAFIKGLLGLKKNTPATIELASIPKDLNVYIYKETKIK
jgi:hypothetical protein